MTTCKPGEIYLVAFPFTGADRAKLRPALVIADSGDNDVLLARITTQLSTAQFDVPLTDWKVSGLLAPSVVRLHKLATIEKRLLSRRLGQLTAQDYGATAVALKQLLAAW